MSPFTRDPEFDPSRFLAENWQQKPALLSGFLTDFQDPITPEDLSGLACEAPVESRLVTAEKGHLTLAHGPFPEQQLRQLPDRDWTLLVQAVDQWDKQVSELKQAFDFLPSWRIDDIMVSYAAPGGGVGPHVDYYDVFLIQGSGQRAWRVGPRSDARHMSSNATGLSQLSDFNPEYEFTLNQGDVLYLPPGFSHCGEAVSEGMCFSLGFRAPSLGEMLEGLSDRLIARAEPSDRFIDGSPSAENTPGEIDPRALQGSFQRLLQACDHEQEFQRWFGCHVTEPRYPEQIDAQEPPLSPSALLEVLRGGKSLRPNAASRFAYQHVMPEQTLLFFVDGEYHTLPSDSLPLVQLLCRSPDIEWHQIKQLVHKSENLQLITALTNQGSLQFDG